MPKYARSAYEWIRDAIRGAIRDAVSTVIPTAAGGGGSSTIFSETWDSYADALEIGTISGITKRGSYDGNIVDVPGSGDKTVRVANAGFNPSYAVYEIDAGADADFTIDFVQYYTTDNAGNRVVFRVLSDTDVVNSLVLDTYADGDFYTISIGNSSSVIRRCDSAVGIVNVASGSGHGGTTGAQTGRIRVTRNGSGHIRIRVYSGVTELLDYEDTSPPPDLATKLMFQISRYAGGSGVHHQLNDLVVTPGDLGAPS